MSDYSDLTRRLADLIVQFGANVQPGQLLGVTSYVGKEELTREIARAAYERGAKFVDVWYSDQWVKRERLLHGDPETFSYIPPWMTDRMQHFSDEHAARISLSGPQAPHALDDVPADRSGLDLLPYLPGTGALVNLPHDQLVRRPRADAGLGRDRLPRRRAATRPRPALAGDRARLPARRGRSRRRLDGADGDVEAERDRADRAAHSTRSTCTGRAPT